MTFDEPTLICPVLMLGIDAGDCIFYQDCVDGMIKPRNLPEAFRAVEGYKRICENCPNREDE